MPGGGGAHGLAGAVVVVEEHPSLPDAARACLEHAPMGALHVAPRSRSGLGVADGVQVLSAGDAVDVRPGLERAAPRRGVRAARAPIEGLTLATGEVLLSLHGARRHPTTAGARSRACIHGDTVTLLHPAGAYGDAYGDTASFLPRASSAPEVNGDTVTLLRLAPAASESPAIAAFRGAAALNATR